MGDQNGYVLLRLPGPLRLSPGALQQKACEHLCIRSVVVVGAHHDAAGMEIVIERLGLPQEFRAENDVVHAVLLPDGIRVAHGNRGFDDHEGLGIDLQRPFNGVLHRGGVEKVVHIVIIRGRGDDHQLGGAIGRRLVSGRMELQRPLPFPGLFEKPLDLLVPDRAEEAVQLFGLCLRGGDRRYFVLLGEKDGQGQTHIPNARNCDFHCFLLP